MSRIEQIPRAGYEIKIAWEFDFDREGKVEQKPELLTHPIVQQTPLYARDALYGGFITHVMLRQLCTCVNCSTSGITYGRDSGIHDICSRIIICV